ncbi:MAG: hypothetical protein MI861_10085, partial [Pirellulales bacterium]|nr:hypothetical protein [Pirellulales bacterium]
MSAGTEILRVDAVNADNTISVTRGALGTTATTHSVATTFSTDYPDVGRLALNFQTLGTLPLEPVAVRATELLLEGIDNQETVLKFAELPDFAADRVLGRTIRVGSEEMYISAISDKTAHRNYVKVWVIRGHNGTTPAPAAAGEAVELDGFAYTVDSSVSLPASEFWVRVGDELLRINGTSTLAALGWTAADPLNSANKVLVVEPTQRVEMADLGVSTGTTDAAYGVDIPATSGVMEVNVTDTHSLPETPFLMKVGQERFVVTSIDHEFQNLTVTRAAHATVAQAHDVGSLAVRGTMLTVDDASVLPTEFPFTVRIGGEELLIHDVDVTHDLVLVERATRHGGPRAHVPQQTIGWGKEELSPGYNHLPVLLTAAALSTGTEMTVTSDTVLPDRFEIRIHDEEMLVSSAVRHADGTSTLTVTRGIHGTTPEDHVANSNVLILTAAGQTFRFLDGNDDGTQSIDIGAAEAQIFTVNTTADHVDLVPGDGKVTTPVAGQVSLRAAIMEANALPGSATIVLPDGTYLLSSELVVSSEIHVSGQSAIGTIIQGTSSRAFSVDANGKLRATKLTLTGTSLSEGGAVLVDQGTLELDSSIVTGSSASSGGAVANLGGQLLITASTLHGNSATSEGGAIYSVAAATEIKASTISGNSATVDGGAIIADVASALTLLNTTVANNTSDGVGGIVATGQSSVANTLIATNMSSFQDSDIGGHFGSLGNNLIGVIPASPYFLAGSLSIGQSTFSINQTSGLPAVPFDIIIDSEQMQVTKVEGNTLTVTRGANEATHFSGAAVRIDGFWRSGDQGGSAGLPLDPKISSLGFDESLVPVHSLQPSSPAIDGGSEAHLGVRKVLATGWSEGSGRKVFVNEWVSLPKAPFQISTSGVTRNVVDVDRNGLVLDQPLTGLQAGAEISILTDQRGYHRAFEAAGSGSTGGSSGGSSGGQDPPPPGPATTDFVDIGAYELVPFVNVVSNTPTALEATGGTTSYTFTVTRSGYTAGELSVDYIVTGAGAHPADASDFQNGQMPIGSVTFLAGDTSKLVTITVAGDSILESDESFQLKLLPPLGAVAKSVTAQATIENDDSVTFTVSDPSVAEGGGLLFDVTLAGSVQDEVWLGWSTTSSTATADVDYTDDTGELRFSSHQTTQEFVVRSVEDVDVEANQVFDVNLSLLTTQEQSSHIALVGGTGTIENDDPAAPSDATISISSVESLESEPEQEFTITLNTATGSAVSPVTVTVDTAALTARPGEHFEANSEQLTFSGQDGESQSFVVPIHDDRRLNNDPQYEVQVSTVQAGGQSVDASAVGVGRILNDDSGWHYGAHPCGSGSSSGSGGGSGGGSGSGGSSSTYSPDLGTEENGPWPIPIWASDAIHDGGQEYWDGAYENYFGYTRASGEESDDLRGRGHWPGGSHLSGDAGARSHGLDKPHDTCEPEDVKEEADPPPPAPSGRIEAEWVVPHTQPLTFNPFSAHDFRLDENAVLTVGIGPATSGKYAATGDSISLDFGTVTVNPDFTVTYTPNPNPTGLLPEEDAFGNVVRFTGREEFRVHIVNPEQLAVTTAAGYTGPALTPYASKDVEFMVSNHLPAMRGDYLHELHNG